jgi:hypothetical protein
MRAKFTVNPVKEYGYGGKEAELSAVHSGNPEDNQFAKATPSGSIKITIDNPAAKDFLTPGKSYYVGFSIAE